MTASGDAAKITAQVLEIDPEQVARQIDHVFDQD